jgi:hypothetical protein
MYEAEKKVIVAYFIVQSHILSERTKGSHENLVRFEVLMAVTTKSTIFLYVKLCILVEAY